MMKKMVLGAVATILFSASAMAGREPKAVSEIRKELRKYNNDRIRVVGYISDVSYVPHSERATLNIKLTDEIIKREELNSDNYLLLREEGFNIGVLRAVFEHLEVLQKEGKKIVAEGRYDGDIDALELRELYLKYEYKTGKEWGRREWERYEIDTDKDDKSPYVQKPTKVYPYPIIKKEKE